MEIAQTSQADLRISVEILLNQNFTAISAVSSIFIYFMFFIANFASKVVSARDEKQVKFWELADCVI